MYVGRIMDETDPAGLRSATASLYEGPAFRPVPDPRSRRDRSSSRAIPSPISPPSGCVFRTRCPMAIAKCAEAVPPMRETEPGRSVACIRDEEPNGRASGFVDLRALERWRPPDTNENERTM